MGAQLMLAAPSFTSPRTLWLIALGVSVLTALGVVDQHWPSAGLWLFVGLSLTLGMGHGVLDAALLLLQFTPLRRATAVAAIYLVLVLAAGVVLSQSVGWALLALLAMSLWHFGELYRTSLAARLAVGGVGVMAPMLLSHGALKVVIEPAFAGEQLAVWRLWHGLAVLWALGTAVWALWLGYQWLAKPALAQVHNAQQRQALAEVVAVLLLNTVLSPLMAFAVYFGLWHSTAHMARVGRAVAKNSGLHQPSRAQWAALWAAAGVLTALLLLILWHYLPAVALANDAQTHIVQWLVVALGAVTLPHMLLVAYSHRWLGR